MSDGLFAYQGPAVIGGVAFTEVALSERRDLFRTLLWTWEGTAVLPLTAWPPPPVRNAQHAHADAGTPRRSHRRGVRIDPIRRGPLDSGDHGRRALAGAKRYRTAGDSPVSQPTEQLLALAAFNDARLDEDERFAREASGSTVIGELGNWRPSPAGDEWEAFAGEVEEELLVALRPDLPRPPEVMSGMWGAWVSNEPDDCDPSAGSAMPALTHAARQDPARILREVAFKRLLIANWREFILRIDAEPDPEKRERLTLTRHGLDQVAFQMAAVHDQHPDYQEGWRP